MIQKSSKIRKNVIKFPYMGIMLFSLFLLCF
uniref:Uncharacterized protein n=1 Tax=Siphoviridae sp. ctNZc11 TaxID=2827858 RepID=A0A8S5TCB0_9CAUD|nr:MAG TPA: hypothetical protein [Siphoviridae sp. ctNZc11]